MKRLLVLFAALLAVCGTALAQKTDTQVSTSGRISGTSSGKPRGNTGATVKTRPVGGSRWEFTGNVGFDFRDNYIHLSLSPGIGYAVTSYFLVGAGVNYNYYDNRDTEYKTHTFGLSAYARFYILQYITLQLQPEAYRSWRSPSSPGDNSRVVASMLAGAGLTFPISPGNHISVMLYYDLLRSPHSRYGDKLFYSVGYGFRF